MAACVAGSRLTAIAADCQLLPIRICITHALLAAYPRKDRRPVAEETSFSLPSHRAG